MLHGFNLLRATMAFVDPTCILCITCITCINCINCINFITCINCINCATATTPAAAATATAAAAARCSLLAARCSLLAAAATRPMPSRTAARSPSTRCSTKRDLAPPAPPHLGRMVQPISVNIRSRISFLKCHLFINQDSHYHGLRHHGLSASKHRGPPSPALPSL